MAGSTFSTDELELEYDFRFRAQQTGTENPRELSGREKYQHRARFSSRKPPQRKTHDGACRRRRKRYAN